MPNDNKYASWSTDELIRRYDKDNSSQPDNKLGVLGLENSGAGQMLVRRGQPTLANIFFFLSQLHPHRDEKCRLAWINLLADMAEKHNLNNTPKNLDDFGAWMQWASKHGLHLP